MSSKKYREMRLRYCGIWTFSTRYRRNNQKTNFNDKKVLVISISYDPKETSILFKWFNNIYKVKSDKCHLLMSGNKAVAYIDSNRIEPEDTHELLGIPIVSS